MMDSNYVNGKQSVLVKQRIKTNIRVVTMSVLAVAALLTVPQAPNSYAESVNNSPNTLKVSPVRTDITIAAGGTKTVQTTITNLTQSAITVTPVENDFVAGDERGTPALILDTNKYAPTHSLKRYMVPLTNVTIPANQAKTVNVVINVPQDAQPGGYFGAIRFAPASTDGSQNVNLSTSVASIILMTVPGDTVEKVQLTNFDIQRNGKSDSIFQTPDDLQVALRFQNQGNLQEGPFGKISVKEGDKVVYAADFNDNDPRDVVLPDSARRWEVPLQNIKKFGHYTVYGTFTYGSKNQTIEVQKSFWVIPISYIIGAVVAVILLILLIIGIVFGLRGYKRRILKGHGRSGGGYRR